MGKLFWTCPFCQANLDFGERCDCLDVTKKIDKLHDEAMEKLQKKEDE